MITKWFLASVIALASAILLGMLDIVSLARLAYERTNLSFDSVHTIIQIAAGVIGAMAIIGPFVLARRYKVGFLAGVIALASAMLLGVLGAIILARRTNLSSDSGHAIIQLAVGVAGLTAIIGPFVLARRYKVGFWRGLIGYLLCLVTMAIIMLPKFYVRWGSLWSFLALITYLASFSILYLNNRRQLRARRQLKDQAERFGG